MTLFSKWFQPKQISNEDPMKKFLIVGLGNIGPKYENTRHNIGFKVLDELAKQQETSFTTDKLGDVAVFKFKGRTFILLKPSTYMNLSGKSVKYWMEKEKIPQENILVISDDLNIDFGTFRLKAKGSAGGHNGLKDINEKLGNQNYARFRFGISAMFGKGRQVDYVLGEWDKDEMRYFPELLDKASKLVLSFGTAGIGNTMNEYNGKQVEDL
ncbi:aminoacyl-tRNA hydrolase [Wenyingzhuangia sp. chi5]|uniref:Peptidyl-tRNA hydrolase n=1 Tax=Wenyingzhuangia gilva TaxID=3057677 RepID=A0ABT8VQF5_9FLAO|nr:aminoacyl-tRNA hydrolase [Wenyingzhuangia sp. chi5]MDO3694172.1 aminoacyl-tRNA hydrolase [Wenyingzhuangia sp. chi5]